MWQRGSVLVLFLFGLSCSAYKDEPFFQDSAERFTFGGTQIADWKQLPFIGPISQVEVGRYSNEALILTQSALYSFLLSNFSVERIDSQLKIPISASSKLRKSSDGTSRPLIIYSTEIYVCTEEGCETIGTSPMNDGVNDMVLTSFGDLWMGNDDGLFLLRSGEQNVDRIAQVNTTIKAVAFDEGSWTIAAGYDLLWRYLPELDLWHFFRTPGIIDDNISALTFDSKGVLWIANDVCLNKQYPNLIIERVGGWDGGLPMSNLTSLTAISAKATPNAKERHPMVYVGSLFGAARYSPSFLEQEQHWNYYYGPRWLPSKDFSHGQTVISITALQDAEMETVVLGTDMGVSVIQWKSWTLEEKAQVFQEIVYPRHDRYGLTTAVNLAAFGDLQSYQQYADENSGLWTGMYVASQCYRYAVTKDPDAQANAWKGYLAMEFLANVTCVPGLMARTYSLKSDGPLQSNWHNSSCYSNWKWEGDTSSDEVTGHMYTYPLVYSLLDLAPQDLLRPKRLLQQIMKYIIDNNYYLIDVTGKPTTWGNWNPYALNNIEYWVDQRGVNSLQILSWILTASDVSHDDPVLSAYFTEAFDSLISDYGYGFNILNQKITQPSNNNYSDDELAFLPYHTWIHTKNFTSKSLPVSVQSQFELSLKRSFEFLKKGKSSLWNAIYGSSGFPLDPKDLISTLKSWPLDWIDWPTLNSHRADITLNPEMGRETVPMSNQLLPWDERSMLRWNSNPFVLDDGSGFQESEPTAYLLPYWIARYYGIIQ